MRVLTVVRCGSAGKNLVLVVECVGKAGLQNPAFLFYQAMVDEMVSSSQIREPEAVS